MVKGSPPASGVVETPVDRYRLLERVGEGTFSVVHKACPSTAPGTQVAVKRLKKVEQAGARIRDEVGCLMALRGCEHVVPIIDCVRDGNHVDIVMPYFEHTDFADALSKNLFRQITRSATSVGCSGTCTHPCARVCAPRHQAF